MKVAPLLLLLAASFAAASAHAQSYPVKPVRIISPYSPGAPPTPAAFAVLIAREIPKWRKVIEGARITVE